MAPTVEIKMRSYQCFSPLCDGSVKAIDKEPKPHGRAALCWCCESDKYTVPRYGATEEAVAHHPKVTRQMLGSRIDTSSLGNWQATFAGLLVSNPHPGQAD